MRFVVALGLVLLGSRAFAAENGGLKGPDRVCKKDSDCVATCSLGSVSKTWMEANNSLFRDCEDGCKGWGQISKCVNQKCTVLKSDGQESTRCNSMKYRVLIVPEN
jgi:hypothetical protein